MSGDRFVSPCPLPNAVEQEILDVLIEEAAEAIQRATKLKRFGRDEVQPGQPDSNKRRLGLELGDLAGMVMIAQFAGLIDVDDVIEGQAIKLERFEKYRQHRPASASSQTDGGADGN